MLKTSLVKVQKMANLLKFSFEILEKLSNIEEQSFDRINMTEFISVIFNRSSLSSE